MINTTLELIEFHNLTNSPARRVGCECGYIDGANGLMRCRISVSLNCSTLYWILKRDNVDTDILAVYSWPGVIKFPVEHAGNAMTHWENGFD